MLPLVHAIPAFPKPAPGKPLLRIILLVLGLMLGWPAAGATPDQAAKRRTVLVLYSNSPDVPGFQELGAAIHRTLQSGSPVPVDILSEYTGLDRFQGEAYQRSLLSLYHAKYEGTPIDLLIPIGPTALEFIVSKGFRPGVPVVSCYVASRIVQAAREKRPELTGALPAQNATKTLDLMLATHPATRRIHVILGASPYELEQAERGRALFAPYAQRVQLEFWNGLSLEQMESRIAKLPDEDLVLFGSLLQDAAGRVYTSNLALNRVCRASRRPVYGVIGEDLGEGITGGILLSMGLSGRASAELGLKVLGGTPASAIPILPDTGAAPMFDWRELQRFGIRERNLPPGSDVRFRKVGLWEAYWKVISGALAVIGIETLLVAALVVQLRKRKRTERALVSARQRYRTVADFTHDWEFWQRPDGSFDYVSPACERITGHPPSAFQENPALLGSLVLEEDRPTWEAFQAEALAGREEAAFAYRIRVASGELRWVEQASNPVQLDGTHLGGSRGSIRDITDRKQAELDLKQAYREIQELKDRLEAENTYYREKIQAVEPSSELLGRSDAMKYLLFRIRQVAPSETTVLIQGETGTGKELVAETVHRLGPRSNRPLIKMNCAALPPGVAESELFGHERGAFTGAQSQRKGRFELADGATLFLDEVGELSPEVQAKLLRVLQDGSFQRVGGDRTLKVDVRVIAATNRDLGQEVAAGRFREDLWYRLNVFPITAPSLRQHKEDLPILVQAFIERLCAKLGRPVPNIPTSVITALQAHAWPGNVRELQNVLERAVLATEGSVLRLADAWSPVAPPRLESGMSPESPQATLEEVERRHVTSVLEACTWRVEGKGGAAERLGLKPSTLRSLMTRLGISRGR